MLRKTPRIKRHFSHLNLTDAEWEGVRVLWFSPKLFSPTYADDLHSFGFGRNALGAGAIGEKPNITKGNNKLKFDFGKKCISISDTVIDENLELIDDKETNFLLIV